MGINWRHYHDVMLNVGLLRFDCIKMCCNVPVPPVPKRVLHKEDKEKESDDKQSTDANNDPSAPITNKGILTSFVNGKKMAIPEQDLVCGIWLICKKICEIGKIR